MAVAAPQPLLYVDRTVRFQVNTWDDDGSPGAYPVTATLLKYSTMLSELASITPIEPTNVVAVPTTPLTPEGRVPRKLMETLTTWVEAHATGLHLSCDAMPPQIDIRKRVKDVTGSQFVHAEIRERMNAYERSKIPPTDWNLAQREQYAQKFLYPMIFLTDVNCLDVPDALMFFCYILGQEVLKGQSLSTMRRILGVCKEDEVSAAEAERVLLRYNFPEPEPSEHSNTVAAAAGPAPKRSRAE